MAVQVGYEQAGSYTASDDRKINALGVMHNGTAAGGNILRAGIMPSFAGSGLGADGSEFGPTGSGNMTATISPGRAVVAPNYRVSSDAVTTITFPAVGASARTDLVVLRVYDAESGDAQNLGQIEVVQGPAGGATPATPARSLPLWRVAFAANTTASGSATWTDLRVYTAAPGGIVRQVAPNGNQFANGQFVYDQGVDRLMYRRPGDGVMIGVANKYHEQWDNSAFGATPADGTQLRIRCFHHYGVTDQYGLMYIPTNFTQSLVMAVGNPSQDQENIQIVNWNARTSNMSSAAFWCYRISGGGILGAANQGATIDGIMLGS